MHPWPRLAVILLIISALALAACGADPTATAVPPTPTAEPAPTEAPTATSAPTPTPTAPAMATTAPPRHGQPSATTPDPAPTGGPPATGRPNTNAAPPDDFPSQEEIACITAQAGPDWRLVLESDTIDAALLDCLTDENVVRLLFLDNGLGSPPLRPTTLDCLMASGFAADLRDLFTQPPEEIDPADAFAAFIPIGLTLALCLPQEDLRHMGLDDGDAAQLRCLKDLGLTTENLARLFEDPGASEEMLAQCPAPDTGPAAGPGETPPPSEPATPAGDETVPEEAARGAAAAHLGAPPLDLALVHWQAHTWSNGCRGCTAPDSVCTEAEVEGFIAVYEHQETGRSVRVHVDADGAPAFATTRCYGGPDP